MNKLTKSMLWIGALVCGPALATPIAGSSLQNTLTAAGAVVDVNNDQYQPDEIWTVGGTGVGVSQLLFELAGFANQNAFGIYDVHDPGTRLTIFSGSHGAGAMGVLQLSGTTFCAGQLFGPSPSCASFVSNSFAFFLDTPQGTFYSQSDANADQTDHMVAFQGGAGRGTINGQPWLANEFILAWEDLFGGGDRDFDDFVVLVESVTSVPEPGTLALFGIGLLGVGLVSRRKMRTA